MVDQKPYYFETLPLHSRPKKFESLTSYITRLAMENDISSLPGLAQICFSDQSLYTVQKLNDFPLLSLKSLQVAAYCSESLIQEMTFSNLGQKFGRMYSIDACHTFLNGSIVPFLRYCPPCLREKGYYSLLWRFRFLKGCSDHACYLVDACWYCGELVPIFPSSLQIGICPRCKSDLKMYRPQSLTKELEETHSLSQDLSFLLSPQPWETETALVQHIGKQFTLLREARRLTIEDIARQTGLSLQSARGVEYDIIDTYTTTFQSYLQYANFLGISLRNIFEIALEQSESKGVQQARKDQIAEDQIIDRIQKAVKMLEDCKKPLTVKTVSQIAQLTDLSSNLSPRVGVELQQIIVNGRKEQKQRDVLEKKELSSKVHDAIQLLEKLGKPVTYRSVNDILGFSSAVLKENVKKLQLLNQCISQYLCVKQNIMQEEKALMIKVEIAISQLEELNEAVTRIAIAKIVGRTVEDLTENLLSEVLWQNIPQTYYDYLDA